MINLAPFPNKIALYVKCRSWNWYSDSPSVPWHSFGYVVFNVSKAIVTMGEYSHPLASYKHPAIASGSSPYDWGKNHIIYIQPAASNCCSNKIHTSSNVPKSSQNQPQLAYTKRALRLRTQQPGCVSRGSSHLAIVVGNWAWFDEKNGIPTIVLFYGVEHISIGLVKNIYFMFNISMVAGVGSTDHQASKNHDSYGIIRQVSMKVHEGAFLQQQ